MRFIALVLFAASVPCLAQDSESLTPWAFFKPIEGGADQGLVWFELDREALGKSRRDHADLRLRDADGKEIPYALRIRREVDRSEELEIREFNRGVRGAVTEVSVDLGESGQAHNELEIETPGTNFRRRVRVSGSDDAQSWALLRDPSFLFRFEAAGREVDEARIRYPRSRYRYLRVEVESDEQADPSPPEISRVTARFIVEAPARDSQFPLSLPPREPTRDRSRAASQYLYELGDPLPIRALRFTVDEPTFSRPYRLEVPARPSENYDRPIASGTLERRPGDEESSVEIEFEETFSNKIRLIVTDDRNPPLPIRQTTALAAAREVVFDASAGRSPFRVYFGNGGAPAPNYDFDSSVPSDPSEFPQAALGGRQANPEYRPPERPLTERAPWVAYAALALACLVLFAVLRGLLPERASP